MDNEHHPKKFSGTWIPDYVHTKLEEGEITPAEAILLAVIQSLSNSEEGCYASNSYLGKRCGRGEWQTSRSIKKLKDMGLLIQTDFDGRRRYLMSHWGTPPTSASAQTTRQTSGKPQGRTVGNHKADLDSKAENKDNSLHPQNGVETSPKNESRRSSNKKATPRWAVKCAEQLATSINKVRKVNHTSKAAQWAKAFRLLHTQEGVEKDRIKKALRWYCRQMERGVPRSDPYFPVIESGAAFRTKFSMVERHMAKSKNEDGGAHHSDRESEGEDVRVVRRKSKRKLTKRDRKNLDLPSNARVK